MVDSFNIDGFIDTLAERVAAKIRTALTDDGPGGNVRPRLLTVEQGAVYLGRTPEAVQHLIAAGKLPVVRADRRVFLDVRDLDAWIDQNKT